MLPSPSWKFIARSFPDAQAAWERDVGLPDIEFTIGISGDKKLGTFHAIASDRDWYARHPRDRRIFVYAGERWERRESAWPYILNETTRQWEPCEPETTKATRRWLSVLD